MYVFIGSSVIVSLMSSGLGTPSAMALVVLLLLLGLGSRSKAFGEAEVVQLRVLHVTGLGCSMPVYA